MHIRHLKWIMFGAILALLLLGHGIGADWPDPPPGQPAQMSSRVEYDPKLSDPFFESEDWSCPNKTAECEGQPRVRHTAKCFSTSFGVEHLIRFCKAQLLDANMIDLYIDEATPAFDDNLRVQIKDGMFTCQYWTLYRGGPTKDLTWTTKRQQLTLDKKEYQKGDVIKGRIDIEVLDELINPECPGRSPRTITLKGVFKTKVE